jgi:hypothetical protein
MLHQLTRHPKKIAIFLIAIFYLQLILLPAQAGARENFPNSSLISGKPLPRQNLFKLPAVKSSMLEDVNIEKIFSIEPDLTATIESVKNEEPEIGGPSQPEMSAFQSVNSNNLVDLFSGDFSYNIPLIDVGGYPLSLGYRGGISMDQEASWVGLGWNINPGTITRNMRGLPDDFNGRDSVRKINSIRENKTIGVTGGADIEIVGVPQNAATGKADTNKSTLGLSLGVFHNNYKGWGIETGLNVSINSGTGAKGPLSGGLSFSNNTQEGVSITPSLSLKIGEADKNDNSGFTGNLSMALPYNSRSGLRGLQVSAGVRQYGYDEKNQKQKDPSKMMGFNSTFSSTISFASPSFTPTISIPYTSRQFSFTGKVGNAIKTFDGNLSLSGYVSKQRIDKKDTSMALPSYGYLHFDAGSKNSTALLDFNREKDIPYREKPAVPHIGMPNYTYDAFSITGEGTGGMFRAYRGDVGYVNDHFMRTKDESDRLSVDIGLGDLVHAGVDLNINRAFTESGPWTAMNPMARTLAFKSNEGTFEGVYFRNPGEKSINSKAFYDALGGDDVVAVKLYQPGTSSSSIQTTNILTRYRNKKAVGEVNVLPTTVVKQERDKRTQVISYLTAKDASKAGLNKHIENYTLNQFSLANCGTVNFDNVEGPGTGLPGEYYNSLTFSGTPVLRNDPTVNFNWVDGGPISGVSYNKFTIRWAGRIKAPATGTYSLKMTTDDGVRLWLNDSLLINHWDDHPATGYTASVNLVKDEVYRIKIEYYENKGKASVKFEWTYPGVASYQIVPQTYLYGPPKDTFVINSNLVKENRVNKFRKDHHISEIDVLNNDGRRYVYGIPVYNLAQREATFAISNNRGNKQTGLAGYTHGTDNTANNQNGKDWYYNSEVMPAYAHSFLLTGILSPDYVDLTGNGVSDDDLGDAVKFNYSKVSGLANPFEWRAPFVKDSVTYNEGFKTDSRDDKGNYVYGTKELWYLHSIESKTMIATFKVEDRLDLPAISESGNKYNGGTKRLKEINLYSKADFLKDPSKAKAVKTVHFEYTYELCKGVNKPLNDSGKLTLKKVWFSYNGNNKGKRNPYVFHYNSNNPVFNIKSYDRWGNFKDPLQNPGSITSNVIGNDEHPYSLQDSALAATNSAAWTLDSISLPSGGSMKVQFESDEYAFVQHKRAMQMFKLLGFGSSPGMTSGYSPQLYTRTSENLYAYISVPEAVATKKEVYEKYLSDIKKLYFKMFVRMPGDNYGSGYEYVPSYANLEDGGYGRVNNNTIWVKMTGISLKGDKDGSYSPLAKAGIQFLRLNLPSKAYPGSEVGDNIDLKEAVTLLFNLTAGIMTTFSSFDRIARDNLWASTVDLNRTYIRLNNPGYRKFGGGHRVKRITIYDNWDKMTNQRPATYGQEYTYTASKEIFGADKTISSGVACYEPGIGNEENPFRIPIEYIEQVAPLAPVTMGYTEEPLGESLFPSASVGYSKVRVRSIHYKDKKSANGYSETQFFTAYDFPTYTDRSLIDESTKKRYKPGLANFLRINARHHLVLSQGFKIELNDMHGKMRSQAVFAENDPKNYVSYTENIYKVEDPLASQKRLANKVMAMRADGSIDSMALIGKDVELMVDMRQQLSVTNGYNVSLNSEMFSIPLVPPVFILPTLLNLAQREENLYRCVATLKVIQRYGIIDSVISIDKGSKVSSKDILYDSETGEALLNRTQNEFKDPIYSFIYPSHWAYEGMGLAYKNIDITLKNVTIRGGKIVSGLSVPDSTLFSGGDEILVGGKQKTGGATCTEQISTFPHYTKIWAIDSSMIRSQGPKAIYFIDEDGNPYTGFSVTMRIVRSGRRNQLGAVGSVTTLENPVIWNSGAGKYELVLNTNSKVISTGVAEFKQQWKVGEVKKPKKIVECIEDDFCECLKPFFDYIVSSNKFLITQANNITVRELVDSAIIAGYPIDTVNCSIIKKNLNGLFYEDTVGNPGQFAGEFVRIGTTDEIIYKARLGNCTIRLRVVSGIFEAPLTWLAPRPCGDDTRIRYNQHGAPDQDQYTCSNYLLTYVPNDTLDLRLFYKMCSGEDAYYWGIPLSSQDSTMQFCALDSMFKGVYVHTYSNYTNYYTPYSYYTLTSNQSPPCADSLYTPPWDVELEVESCTIPMCDTIVSTLCYNPVTDTLFNPYVYGALGNWRGHKSYVYYGERAQINPAAATNIRRDGTFAEFTPFWAFNSGKLIPQYDTTKWVWNSEMTLFNNKGVEVENKDPLGRYNAGIYGYNQSLPTAVIQNSKYRESAFDGFEDYGFTTRICDTACPSKRHFDFSSYANKIDTLNRHTGKSSLKLQPEDEVAVSFNLTGTDNEQVYPNLSTQNSACVSTGPVLKSIKATGDLLLPSFMPTKGKRMLLSAWVKEAQDCKCISFTNNRIVVVAGSNSYIFQPKGSIIEGWQRYEAVFDIPSNATTLTVSLEATGSVEVNFDDLRIHPFNANMKSFVFDPINLRLMAELDENNYASFYEYDDDGTLIRSKKETQRGVKTITETRSALRKEY